MKKNIIVIILLVGLIATQCSKFDSRPDLKQSLQQSVNDINLAVSKISASKGYELITVTDETSAVGDNPVSGENAKSSGSYNMVDTITLDMVAGIYDFQPDATRHWHFFFPISLFKKTGESDHMVVNMPHRLVFRPKYLFNFHLDDSIPANNFKIDASAYHLYTNGWNSFDYNLVAGFNYESEDIGGCEIVSKANPQDGIAYTSEFVFAEGFSLMVGHSAIDTARSSSFALMDGDDILLKETSVLTKLGYRMLEKQYVLTIGNVEIKRTTGIDSIQVFLDGVLQKKAAVKIVDEDESDDDKDGWGGRSICHSRDLLITFDDGTTTNLSTLIDPALVTLKSLVASLGDMYFARRVVDYIALSIALSPH